MSDYSLEEALNAADSTTEELFVIDSDLRTIQGPPKYVLGVFNDQNVQTVHFKCPRHYNDIDLSMFSIKINYMNALGKYNMSLAKNLEIVDDYMTFDWLTSQTVFASSGTVTFNICLTKVDTDGHITNEFNTTIYSLKVLEGLEVTLSESEETEVEHFLEYINNTKEHIDSVKESITNDKTSISAMKDAVINTKDHIDSVSGSIAEDKTAVSNMKDSVTSLVNDAKAVHEKITNDKTSICVMKDAVTSDKAYINSVKDAVTSDKASISEIKNAVTSDKASISSMKDEVANTKEHIDSVKESITNDKTSISEMKDTITSDKAYVSSMKDAVTSLVNDTKDLYEKTKAIAEDLNGLTGLSDLEKRICMDYLSRRTGEVFETRFYYHSVNQTSSGIKKIATGKVFKEFKDSTLSATPSTNLVDNPDDFLGYLPFQWDRCNYVRDDNTFARPIAMKGDLNYKEEGSVDVGTIAPTFFWRLTEYPNLDGTPNMYGIMMSDSPHPELGLVPFSESIIPGKGYMPYYILSAFPSGIASDGLLRSQPNLTPAYSQTYDSMKTEYAKKGAGYTGSTSGRHLHWIIFNLIKYGTKNSQNVMCGCSDFNEQTIVIKSEESVKRVIVESTNIYPGACVSISASDPDSIDRAHRDCHSTCDRVRVKSVDDIVIDGKNCKAINLDIPKTINTEVFMYITSMPCFTGETESVQGKKDGSYLSNTDGRHTLRIHGVEYAWGQYNVLSDQLIVCNIAENAWDVYTCKKGQKHTANLSDYKLIGKISAEKGTDYWIGDLGFDCGTSGFYVKTVGSGSGTGVGDKFFQILVGSQDKVSKGYSTTGTIADGSSSGSGYVYCSTGVRPPNWEYGSCD